MTVLRRHGPSEKVVLFAGPRDGEELVILDAAELPAEIPDEIQGHYQLGDLARPERDRQGRPIYRWMPPVSKPYEGDGDGPAIGRAP